MATALRVRLGAAGLLCAGVAALAGCSDSSDSADATSATPSTTASTSSATTSESTPTTTSPTETSDAPVSEVPAPANWESMTCKDFSELTPSEQVAIFRAQGSPAPLEALTTAAKLMSVGCQGFPDLPLKDALAGNIPG